MVSSDYGWLIVCFTARSASRFLFLDLAHTLLMSPDRLVIAS